MNVLMISPGYPPEMPLFTRGLAAVGARVIGLGDQPEGALPAEVRQVLSGYVQVRSFGDEAGVIEQLRRVAAHTRMMLRDGIGVETGGVYDKGGVV